MQTGDRSGKRRRTGAILVAFTLALALILGSVGLTYDIGRMYITRDESQSFCDSSAISAALKLDGTQGGITNATTAAQTVRNLWKFGSMPFSLNAVTVEFAQDPVTGWSTNPTPATGYTVARVTTSLQLPMAFMPVLTGKFNSTIGTTAIAKQVPIVGKMLDVFPFTPYWLPPTASNPPAPASDPFGMVPARMGNELQHGGIYTLRGPANLKDTGGMCANDATTLGMDYRNANGQPDRGYIWTSPSASDIRGAILGNEAPAGKDIAIGDSTVNGCDFCLDPGTKQSEVKAIQDRIGTDSDQTTVWYQDYYNTAAGNDARVVVVPISTAQCGGLPTGELVTCPQITLPDGTTTTAGSNTVVGFAAFFLHPSNTYGNPLYPICAEYLGPWVPNQAGGAPPGAINAYTVVLVQ